MKKINVRVTDDKPYIFVSYAHADDEEVYPIIEELDRRGYRVWYDYGIPAGEKWAEVIGSHVMGCQIMLLFISDHYAASSNCEDEWTFAQKHKKNFVCIMLQQTKLSPGMDMQTSKRQNILKYETQDEEAFYEALCNAPGMELCLREPELPVKDKRVEEKCDEVKKEKRRPKGGSGDWFRKGLVAALGALVLLFVIAWIAGQGSPSEQPGGQEGVSAQTNASDGADTDIPSELKEVLSEVSVSLSDMAVTADMIGTLSENKNLHFLYFENCSFETGVLSQLSSATAWKLSMKSCTGVDDLSCLNQMPELDVLVLTDNALKDGVIPVLVLSKLYSVDVSRNPELSDLSWLAETNKLSTLDISETKIADLSPIASASKLTVFSAENCPITDITPLQAAQKLVTLDLNGCPVGDSGVIVSCLRLEELHLSGAAMTTLQPFENCTILKEVDISGSAVADVSTLQKSAATLQKLNFSNSALDGEDLQFMKNCTNLTEVYVDGIPTEDISFLKDAEQLQTLSASFCGLKDISALEEKRKLTSLDLSENNILDISPLTKWYVAGQVDLALNDNPLTDINALPVINRYQTLDLRCTELDLDTIPVITCNAISVYYSDAIYDSNLTYKDKIKTYHIYDCPPDRQVALEDYFGYQLELHTSDEVSE